MNLEASRRAFLSRAWVLRAVDATKPWGWELWLTSTRPEAPARLADSSTTLADVVAAHPEALGAWSRCLFGDAMPIFAKFIHTNFPPRVHLGFRRPVTPHDWLGWLEREQQLIRELLGALRLRDAKAFGAYEARYSAWASAQALSGWTRDDDAAAASALAPFVDDALNLRSWLQRVRHNRAAIADALNEIDLARNAGRLFLSSAGVVHSIFGLSHQTHPRDPARGALQTLFATLAERANAGADDAELFRAIDAADLASVRGASVVAAKNEAWLPTVLEGADVLVEPQQTSDTTYSLADFYTPLVWVDDRVAFRKGSRTVGLSRDELAGLVAHIDFTVTRIDAISREPAALTSWGADAQLSRLVDEPTLWPFFTAYQLDLRGHFIARPPPGLFQQLIVIRGRVDLADEGGVVGELSPRAPGFIPATLRGAYTLTAREPSSIVLLSVPGARGNAPKV